MADMYHQIDIEAAPAQVYRAVATADGLRGWWTADSRTDAKVGGSAEFGFDNRGTVFHMRIEDLRPDARVEWACQGDPTEWAGTQLTWELSPAEGGTTLRFTHGNWRSTDGYFRMCNSTWGELMYRLKRFVETQRPDPHWTK